MKNIKFLLTFKSVLLALLVVGLPNMKLFAQEDSAKTGEKPEATIEMKYINENGIRKIKLKATQTVNDEEAPIPFLVVNVYLNEISKAGMMGNINTDENGEGEVLLSTKRFALRADTLSAYKFIASAGSDNRVALSQAELEITDAKLDLKLSKTDTGNYVTVKLYKLVNGKQEPVADEEVLLFVKRSFNNLPITGSTEDGEEATAQTTDENGEITMLVPNDMPGDKSGNIIILAKLEEHAEFGTLISEKPVKWGIPVVFNGKSEIRALWATRNNAPYWLVITVTSIVAGVWLTIAYIIIQLVRVKKLGKDPLVQ